MQVITTAIPDVLVFEPKVFGDDRGYFFESFRQDLFEQHVGHISFVQDNESKSGYGVLRGLHFQKPPFTQSKLVRVALSDCRSGSSAMSGSGKKMHLNLIVQGLPGMQLDAVLRSDPEILLRSGVSTKRFGCMPKMLTSLFGSPLWV